MDKLLPCPECKGEVSEYLRNDESIIKCDRCLRFWTIAELWNTPTPQAPDELLEALEFYADEINHARVHRMVDSGGAYAGSEMNFDQGKRAREALSKYQKPKDKE